MRILVTGGAGFLGRHVAEELRFAGYETAIFDMVGAEDGLGRAASHTEWITGNLLEQRDCDRAVQGADAVFHLAAVGDVYLAHARPDLAAEYNVVGTARLMEACANAKITKLVYASTWEVYGHPRYQPIDESHPCEPSHPYNITKYAGERLALAYHHLRGVPTVSLRLGTAYGPRMRPNTVFSLFINEALAGQPITIQGSGQQTRQFTHVRDIAQAFVSALEGADAGEVFNIVAPEQTSILHLAHLVARQIPAELVFTGDRPGEIAPAVVSAKKAEQLLGWVPKVPFEAGLDEIISQHRNQALAAEMAGKRERPAQ